MEYLRQPIRAKDPRRQYQGAVSRAQGRFFEEFIDAACAYYAERKEAYIEKTPEPMQPTKDLGNGKFIAFYTKQAQPDYKGVLRSGRAVMFEAKFTSAGRVEQDRVTREQAAKLEEFSYMGAVCFVLLSFGGQEFYRVAWEDWRDMKARFGRKYIAPDDLKPQRVPISRKGTLLILEGIE